MDLDFIYSKAKKIQLLVVDVDGVLTDGSIIYTVNNMTDTLQVKENLLESKHFNVQDGMGYALLRDTNIKSAIITARESTVVTIRANELGITHLIQNSKNKIQSLKKLVQKLNLLPEQVCYVGDDLPDLSSICYVGLGIAVENAHNFVKEHADYVTNKKGGNGAVREVIDLILQAKKISNKLYLKYLNYE